MYLTANLLGFFNFIASFSSPRKSLSVILS